MRRNEAERMVVAAMRERGWGNARASDCTELKPGCFRVRVRLNPFASGGGDTVEAVVEDGELQHWTMIEA